MLEGVEFAGIGVGLTPNEDEDLEVSEVIPGGPAEACGQIDIGDVLIEVDGINVEGKKLQEVKFQVEQALFVSSNFE